MHDFEAASIFGCPFPAINPALADSEIRGIIEEARSDVLDRNMQEDEISRNICLGSA